VEWAPQHVSPLRPEKGGDRRGGGSEGEGREGKEGEGRAEADNYI